MALRKYLKIEPENKRKSGEDSSSLSRKDVEMAGREVQRVATGRIRNTAVEASTTAIRQKRGPQ